MFSHDKREQGTITGIGELKMKTLRRYIYQETFKEVMNWTEEMKKIEMIDRPPNGKDNFPFCLQQYLRYLKFRAKK